MTITALGLTWEEKVAEAWSIDLTKPNQIYVTQTASALRSHPLTK